MDIFGDIEKYYHSFLQSSFYQWAEKHLWFVILFFFLFVQKAFHWKIALCASAFLAVVPAYITRTISGVSDKEAMAMIFFFLTLYLFLSFILEKKNWKSFLFVLGAALSGSALWCLLGDFVFVFLSIGAFVLLLVFLERISLRQLFLYMIFFILPLFLLKIFYPERYDFWGLVMTPAIGVLFFALLLGFIHYFLFVKDFFSLELFGWHFILGLLSFGIELLIPSQIFFILSLQRDGLLLLVKINSHIF